MEVHTSPRCPKIKLWSLLSKWPSKQINIDEVRWGYWWQWEWAIEACSALILRGIPLEKPQWERKSFSSFITMYVFAFSYYYWTINNQPFGNLVCLNVTLFHDLTFIKGMLPGIWFWTCTCYSVWLVLTRFWHFGLTTRHWTFFLYQGHDRKTQWRANWNCACSSVSGNWSQRERTIAGNILIHLVIYSN